MGRPILVRILLISLAVAVSADARAAADDPPTAKFRAWWDRLLDAGGPGNSIDGVRISYRVELLRLPPADELARMRREVEGRPDHPARVDLAIYEQRIRLNGQDGDHRTVWRWRGMWRYSGQPLSNSEAYSDLVWGDGIAWGLSRDTLLLLDPRTAHQHPYGLPSMSSNMTFELLALLGGGIGAATARSVPLEPTVSGEGRWRASGSNPETGMRLEASGSWSEEAGWGTVDSVRIVRGDTGTWTKAFDWRYCAPLGLGIASRVDVCDLDGTMDRRLTFEDAAPFAATDFVALSRPPRLDGADPVRGVVTFRKVVDLRGEQPVLGTVEDGKLVTSIVSPPGEQGFEARLRVLGWLIAGSSITLLGVIWARRHLATQPNTK